MNLRTLKASTVGVALLAVAAACTDPTVQPKSTVTETNVFNDASAYQSLLARVYSGLAVSGQVGPAGSGDIQGIDEGFSQYLRLYWECQELPTDEAVIGWNDIGLPEMNTMTWNSSSRMVVAMYYRVGVQVVMANDFLRQTTAALLASRGNVTPALATQIQQWRAEARFLRALSYWHAIDLFGGIPLVTENDPVGGAPPKQVTRDSLYKFVVSELTAIKDSLPTWGAANLGRATQTAAHMLLAELYLNDSVYTGTANYAGALAEASTVIATPGLTLDPSFSHLFSADNRNSPEIIFPIEQDGVNTQTWGGTTFLIHAACGGSMSAGTYGIDYCWGGYRLKQQALRLFAGDPRGAFIYDSTKALAAHDTNSAGKSNVSDSVSDIGNFQRGAAAPKFTNKTSGGASGSNPTFVDTWFPLFRLGEAYLIYAEANLRGGGGSAAQALTYVNALRTRAGAATITAAQLTLPFMRDERGRELLFEAHRRTDLIRFGAFTGNTYLWQWKGGAAGGTATDAHLNIYPLPATELVTNPNLTQNPGY